MAIADRWTVVFTNDYVESTNYQMFGIEATSASPSDVPKVAAQILGYSAVAAFAMASGTRIEELRYIPSGSSVSTLVPFPVAEFAALQALSGGDMAPMDAYGDDLVGAGQPLGPLGTSIVVSEYTATGGPSGRGRHYLPFISSVVVEYTGVVKNTARTKIVGAYEALLLNPSAFAYSSVAIDVDPRVMNAAGDTIRPVTNVKCQPVFSNLESRRR